MDKRTIGIIGVLAILIVATAASGCFGSNTGGSNTPSGTATPAQSSGTSTGAKVPVVVSGDTITITGTKTGDDDQFSETFNLEEGTYLISFENKGGGLGDTFMANIESPSGDYYATVSMTDGKGMTYMTVQADSMFAKPGPAVLNVGYGGTYTVTITRPTSGDSAPVTITGQGGEQIVKVVDLKEGPVTINVKHLDYSSDKQGTTMVGLHNAATGKSVALSGPWITGETGEPQGEITEPGLYVFSVSFRAPTAGEATLTQ